MGKLLLAILGSCILVSSSEVRAQESKLEMFNLNERMNDVFVACIDRSDAIEVADTFKSKDQEKVQALLSFRMTEGRCAVIGTAVIYRRLVYESKTPEGNSATVYIGEVGGVSIYVPMIGLRHREVAI